MSQSTLLELTEFTPRFLPRAALPEAVGETLWRDYAPQVAVQPPSFQNQHQWQFVAQGWVGFIPLPADWLIVLQPKLPVSQVLGMLEYAYGLDMRWLAGETAVATLTEFYERLALALAQQVLRRGRRGFFATYTPTVAQLPFVRGKLMVEAALRRPATTYVPCHFDAFSTDNRHNQLVYAALMMILRHPLCGPHSRPMVQRACQLLQGVATLLPLTAADGRVIVYTRLNEDYRPMHRLCRFFLEHSGPSLRWGSHPMTPFLIDMDHLFEMFVAAWLQRHLAPAWQLTIQESVTSASGAIRLRMDGVIRERASGKVRYVLDTKYKVAARPAHEDIFQIAYYARQQNAPEAVLIYPAPLAQPLDEQLGQLRLRTLTFDIGSDLEAAGQALLRELAAG